MPIEPKKDGGNDYGPTPYQLISGGLAACTAMTLRIYAERKKWELKNVEVSIEYGKEHAKDCMDCENEHAKIDTFTRYINIKGSLDEKQITRLLEIADKCPVHKTLHNKIQIITHLISN